MICASTRFFPEAKVTPAMADAPNDQMPFGRRADGDSEVSESMPGDVVCNDRHSRRDIPRRAKLSLRFK